MTETQLWVFTHAVDGLWPQAHSVGTLPFIMAPRSHMLLPRLDRGQSQARLPELHEDERWDWGQRSIFLFLSLLNFSKCHLTHYENCDDSLEFHGCVLLQRYDTWPGISHCDFLRFHTSDCRFLHDKNDLRESWSGCPLRKRKKRRKYIKRFWNKCLVMNPT